MKPPLTLVTHVDWRHIRQRPHHLAVALAEHYEVTVVAPVSRRRAQLVDNPAPGIDVARLWRLPGSYRSSAVARANAMLSALQCGPRVRRAAIVVVTSPELWPWVEASLEGRTLVYDCMDDALAFDQDEAVRALKARWEHDLVKRADLVVCSSAELASRLGARGRAKNLVVVPNGWDPDAFPVRDASPLPARGPLSLAYFGTVAPWLDFAALRALVRACDDVRVRLIGPVDGATPDDVDGLACEPPVAHAALASAVVDAHVLLLPFRVDALTRAVDPVKLYEYVALGKPILAARWPALDRFAGMVTFYRDASELVRLVRERALPTPPGRREREAFLAPQSWRARAEAIRAAIEPLR